MSEKIQTFKQLDAWKYSHKLVIAVFNYSKKMPSHDTLRYQIERSALSITSNIAEGFGRQSFQDKKHFYIMARGSLYELENQLLVARDINRLSDGEFNELTKLLLNSTRLLHGLVRSLVRKASS